MKWSDEVWVAIDPIYQKIINMPFITELAAGTLDEQKFRFYIAQDSSYLEHFGRALALAGAKAADIKDALAFMRFAENAIVVENALHESYFQQFGVQEKGKIEPACHHYIHYLKSTVAFENTEVGMASLLPCFWIYKAVGDYIYQHARTESNPYQQWIDTYAGEDFGVAVQQAISICDKAAAQATETNRDKMTEAFITASRLEYDFWEGAYLLRQWPASASL